MDRQTFLRACGAAVGAVALGRHGFAQAPRVKARARYKAGTYGQILADLEGQGVWAVHADFGPTYEVMRIREEQDGTYADVCFEYRQDFVLKLNAKGTHWVAVG